MPAPSLLPLLAALLHAPDTTTFIRASQVGYPAAAPKVAVACSLDSARVTRFELRDAHGRRAFGPRRAVPAPGFGPCAVTHRLDFTALRTPGRYRLVVDGAAPVDVRIGADVYAGGADTALHYMRQQRSGWNPVFRDSVHRRDGIIVDSPRAGTFIPVSGGWADASDYLQYVATSATATTMMLIAHRDNPRAFTDRFGADGGPVANGVADVLDEARHGLEWLLRMYPARGEMYNQLGDDRDHAFFDLPVNDSSDYGWGRGRERPVYPCTGAPQGLLKYRNRSTGLASTAGKYASAFALGARAFATIDTAFAATLRARAEVAYAEGVARPGVCQTAPGSAPYFYEEDDYADDMELGAAALGHLREAVAYADSQPVKPWQGADTARHYQWFPWINAGHYETWRLARARGDVATQRRMASHYRRGLEAVVARADNGFRIGVPFIWCSNNLMVAFATQAALYRRMTGDERFRVHEQAAVDWLFGANPWGVSMVVGYPASGVTAKDPHSVVAVRLGADKLLGGLLDGPVYRSIYGNLKGIALHDPDEYARFNTGRMVYHDDLGDYSTNEPIMDGTASLAWLLAELRGR